MGKISQRGTENRVATETKGDPKLGREKGLRFGLENTWEPRSTFKFIFILRERLRPSMLGVSLS